MNKEVSVERRQKAAPKNLKKAKDKRLKKRFNAPSQHIFYSATLKKKKKYKEEKKIAWDYQSFCWQFCRNFFFEFNLEDG